MLIEYINRGVSLSKSLPKEKETEYLKRMREGDSHTKNMLIEHNLCLVAPIAKKHSNHIDNDGIISIGSIGLIKAVNTFKCAKGTYCNIYCALHSQ